jgi:amidohydrolase
MDLPEAKNLAINYIDKLHDELWEIVSNLYENPELAFKEHNAMVLITDYLSKNGFQIEYKTGGLETAFQATLKGSSDGPTVAFLAEYDALPEIGHACGHNLIAAAAVGAGMGMKPIIDGLPGTIKVIGTPAEEGGGGKRIMVEAGVFSTIDAAMMFHPASKNLVTRGSLASLRLNLAFYGKTAHAAASPQEGINALDAMILTFNNINALRQHLEIKDRVAGIITHGGDAANIIPGYTSAEFSVRGESETRRGQVLEKVIACAKAAAKATGSRMEYNTLPGYSEIVPNSILAELFTENSTLIGRKIDEPEPNERMGSTDMGNVSKVVPAIHPYLETVSEEIAGHTVEFAEICMTDSGKAAMLDAAKALAMTGIDLLMKPSLLVKARTELDLYLNN